MKPSKAAEKIIDQYIDSYEPDPSSIGTRSRVVGLRNDLTILEARVREEERENCLGKELTYQSMRRQTQDLEVMKARMMEQEYLSSLSQEESK